MSSTRRVESGERRTQNGWASSPEFDVLRGLNGTAVAFKAALLDDPQKRELLYFLQALSLRDGGVKRIARELVEMFPERIGTPTMIAIGCKPGKRLTREQYDAIHDEMYPRNPFDFADEDSEIKPAKPKPPPPASAAKFCDQCNERASNLDTFIEELCCYPKMEVARPGESQHPYRSVVDLVIEDVRGALEHNPKLLRVRPELEKVMRKGDYEFAELRSFHDILGALFEYKRRYEESARAEFVETSIGKIVFEALDYVLETGKSALIEGSSGFGKTTGLKAWSDIHLG